MYMCYVFEFFELKFVIVDFVKDVMDKLNVVVSNVWVCWVFFNYDVKCYVLCWNLFDEVVKIYVIFMMCLCGLVCFY